MTNSQFFLVMKLDSFTTAFAHEGIHAPYCTSMSPPLSEEPEDSRPPLGSPFWIELMLNALGRSEPSSACVDLVCNGAGVHVR